MMENIFETKVTKEMLNLYGFLHGGEAFKLMDSTAGRISGRFVNGKTLTKAASNVVYHASVYLNETVITSGKITKIGKTSLQVHVENRVKERGNLLSSSGDFTMVFVDDEFKPKVIDKTLE